MREILFRAKRKDNGEWVYGDLLKNIDCIKIREREKDITRIAKSYEVISETVGQYTGLKDINGKKIFEGDIVKLITKGARNHSIYQLFYDVETGQLLMKNGEMIEDCENFYGKLAITNTGVIGNIHDNKELLREE
jgi:uncharacterized phage protein (TIGR01671 family)